MSQKKYEKKSEKIYQGITHINDEIVEEAENARPLPKKSGSLWKAVSLTAACLCLFALGAAFLLRSPGGSPPDGSGSPDGLIAQNSPQPADGKNTGGADAPSSADATAAPDPSPENIPVITLADMSVRPRLLSGAGTPDLDITPNVEPYTIDPDLGNVENLDRFYALATDTDMAAQLARNGFLVGEIGNSDIGDSEFFEVYEYNRYAQVPSFVTVDSLMHTYHLYFSYLLRNIEKNYLADSLTRLSGRMLETSAAQYEQLKDSEWEEAARRNVAFFTVGACLLDDSTTVRDYVADSVAYELDCINSADSTLTCSITGGYEDYTQYIPRGYYEGDEQLGKYFRAMMWYGRIHFKQAEESLDRSALLITMALASDAEAYQTWEAIYAVTSFFAGASDDFGVSEYAPAICEAYGNDADLADLPGNSEGFEAFHALTLTLPPPAINSIPIEDGEDNTIPGFRFMGQRFTIDAAIMQNLIYSRVGENSDGEKRMLPDVLDVAAALGSDTALEILEENGATDYEGYTENMALLKEGLSQDNEALWSASLYAGWLNTLRPLLEAKGEGYPVFMQSEEWAKKNLECFSGSFAELKHDTILYTEQVVAEMGGDWDEEVDDRGYVEPEPLVYARFTDLADRTAQGLKKYGLLTPDQEEDLSRLSQMARQLLTISGKELQDETLTEEEYEFIRSYGGNIEHFWYEASKDAAASDWFDSSECPAPIVADIATDPNGQVLEAATGTISNIFVVVKVDGILKVARGSVYSFYQFTWPAEDRLTDSKWRQMTGCQPDEDGNYTYENPVKQPEWTGSYRYERD
ncbi:MAG: DUF3160 domain-containing protein [Firmicutes bacterium]|nr:DUF3160 domain-containing protein [Bacillota bacterium]